MLAVFWRILLFISALWVVQKVLGLLFGGLRNRGIPGNEKPKSESTSRMVKDPVCGMYLDPRLAIRLEDRKGVSYFCSEECRSKYLAAAS